MLSGFFIDNASGLEGLRTARDSENLHLRLIVDDPLDPLQWGELQTLAKHKPDPLSLALYQAPTKKIEAKVLSERIDNALLPDSTITLEEVYLREKDLTLC